MREGGTTRILEETVKFLRDFSWIYNFKVTSALSDNIVDNIPDSWKIFLTDLSVEEFNEIFYDKQNKASIPGDVNKFLDLYNSVTEAVDSCCKVGRNQRVLHKVTNLKDQDNRGINPKKKHEIDQFSQFLSSELNKNNICIIDIGSGLGYLGERLTAAGFSVVGVEASADHIVRADKRSTKSSSHTFSTIQVNIDDTPEAVEALKNSVQSSEERQICLTGLHCCGDLTPSILKMFAREESFHSVAVLSCCYHKMSHKHSQGFTNFPLSLQLQEAVKTCDNAHEIFNVFLFRLAAQENQVKWRNQTEADHTNHMNNVGFRAVLEKVCQDRNFLVKKKNRRGVLKNSFNNLSSFIQSLQERYEFSESELTTISQDIRKFCEENTKIFHVLEMLTGLQFLLQSVIEKLIICDRFLFLQENCDLLTCEVVEIFDPKLSPRNKLLFAIKQ